MPLNVRTSSMVIRQMTIERCLVSGQPKDREFSIVVRKRSRKAMQTIG